MAFYLKISFQHIEFAFEYLFLCMSLSWTFHIGDPQKPSWISRWFDDSCWVVENENEIGEIPVAEEIVQ